jgi:hypothetical protein
LLLDGHALGRQLDEPPHQLVVVLLGAAREQVADPQERLHA